MQRTVRSSAFPPEAAQSLCLHPLPESQPVLPCLLRRLLQKGRQDDALELARWAGRAGLESRVGMESRPAGRWGGQVAEGGSTSFDRCSVMGPARLGQMLMAVC
jgi:hypothetical protein